MRPNVCIPQLTNSTVLLLLSTNGMLWQLIALFLYTLRYIQCRADSRFVPSQWEMALLFNDVSHWLGTSLESAVQWLSNTGAIFLHSILQIGFHIPILELRFLTSFVACTLMRQPLNKWLLLIYRWGENMMAELRWCFNVDTVVSRSWITVL